MITYNNWQKSSFLITSNFRGTVARTGTGTDQNFIIVCRYFLKKRKLPVGTKTLLFVAVIFLVVIFLFPCDIAVICLCPTYQVMMVYYFSVLRFVEP